MYQHEKKGAAAKGDKVEEGDEDGAENLLTKGKK